PVAALLARREPVSVALGVEGLADAVNPAKAQRLFHRFDVSHASTAGRLLVVPDPQFRRRLVVRLQPSSEGCGRLEEHRLRCRHSNSRRGAAWSGPTRPATMSARK